MVVVVTCPDGVHRGEAHIFIRTPVAADEVVEQVHERVGVDQERPAFTHEVVREVLDGCGVVGAVLVEQIWVVTFQSDIALVGIREHGPSLGMVIQQFAKGRHELETGC